MTSILTLTDGTTDSVSFVGSTTYLLEDGTFTADIPSKKETRAQLTLASGRDLISLSYNNRVIRFSFFVLGATDVEIRDNISKVGRLLLRTHNPIYIDGGSYSEGNTFADGLHTGDNGLVLRSSMSSSAGAASWVNAKAYYAGDYVMFGGNTYVCVINHTSTNANDPGDGGGQWQLIAKITNELNSEVIPSNIMTYRIVSGDLKVLRKYSSKRQMNGKYYAVCEITLEAEPFALGEPRVVSSIVAPGLGTSRTKRQRLFIPAASIPGDGPALTRISTNLSGANGIIIARDAGISLLNSATAPVMAVGNGKNDLFVYANHESNDAYRYELTIAGTGTPDTFTLQRSTYNFGTSSWGSYSNIITGQQIVAGTAVFADATTGLYVYFANSTGHTLGNKWYFESHQVGILQSPTVTDLSVNPDWSYTATGRQICFVDFTIPKGCRSKYKIIAGITFNSNDPTVEIMSRISFIGVNPSNGWQIYTQPTLSDWVLMDFSKIQLGTVDLTPSGTGFTNHPMAFGRGKIEIYLRAMSNVVMSPATVVTVNYVYLVPVQDQDGCFEASWAYDGAGYEFYCNYDYNNPYVAEADRNYFSSGFDGNAIVNDLDYSSNAGPITLIPGVKNTVVMLSTFGVSTGNWRYGAISPGGETRNTYLAIRPRYLHGS